MRPRLLDLFCCQGGAGMGYHRAGFRYVIGIDKEVQPRYPFEFHQRDALEVLDLLIAGGQLCGLRLADFDAIHASPPCQDHSPTKDFGGDHGTGWILAATLERLRSLPVPWVVENVADSPLPHQPDLFGSSGLALCGCMFPELRGLLYEDRLFETSFAIPQPSHVLHQWPQTKMGRPPVPGECMQLTGHFADAEEGRRRMGAPWMNRDGVAQAIPPAFTEFIGARLLEHLASEAAA